MECREKRDVESGPNVVCCVFSFNLFPTTRPTRPTQPTWARLIFFDVTSVVVAAVTVAAAAVLDGIGDEATSTRQPSFNGVRFTFIVFGSDSPTGQQEKSASKKRPWREGDHRLVRSDSTRSQAWGISLSWQPMRWKFLSTCSLPLIDDCYFIIDVLIECFLIFIRSWKSFTWRRSTSTWRVMDAI